jgi:hypothetical protein
VSREGAVARPRLELVRGRIYTDRRQLLARNLVAAYRGLFRWTGSAADAEVGTRRLVEAVVTPLRLPAPVEDVDELLDQGMLETLGRHWADGYEVASDSWTAVLRSRAVGRPFAPVGLRELLDPLPGELRTVVVLRFLRQFGIDVIASRLELRHAAANLLLFEALGAVGVALGLPASSPSLVQAGLVARFVDDLVGLRRPLRFPAGPNTFPALLAAANLQAAIPGSDLPDPRFVKRLCDAAF